MGIDTPRVALFERALRVLNRIPTGEREVRVDGASLFPDSADRLLAAWKWKLGWPSSPEARFLRATLRPGMRVADVGANIGLHTLFLARLVGDAGSVTAIEPEPRNFRALSRAVEHAGAEQVKLHRAAAGAETGSLTLHVSSANRGDHRAAPGGGRRETIEVDSVRLDDLFADDLRLDFVKLDVQGFEAGVFAGMPQLLESNAELVIASELSPALLAGAGAGFEDFFRPLSSRGFVPHRLDADAQPRSLEARTAWELAEREGYCDLILLRA